MRVCPGTSPSPLLWRHRVRRAAASQEVTRPRRRLLTYIRTGFWTFGVSLHFVSLCSPSQEALKLFCRRILCVPRRSCWRDGSAGQLVPKPGIYHHRQHHRRPLGYKEDSELQAGTFREVCLFWILAWICHHPGKVVSRLL